MAMRREERNINYEIHLNEDNLFKNVSFQVFTAVTMKNSVLWDVTPRGSCKN
jgi:hypothetical protein